MEQISLPSHQGRQILQNLRLITNHAPHEKVHFIPSPHWGKKGCKLLDILEKTVLRYISIQKVGIWLSIGEWC